MLNLTRVSIILLLCILIACSDKNKDVPLPAFDEVPEGSIKFNASSKNIAYLDTANGLFMNRVANTLTITSTIVSVNSSQSLKIVCSGVEIGNYPANNNSNSYIEFTDFDGTVYTSKQSPASVIISIEKIDTIKWTLSGSVNGMLYDKNGIAVPISTCRFNTIPYFEPYGGGGSTLYNNVFSYSIDGVANTVNSLGSYSWSGSIVIDNNRVRMILTAGLKPGTYNLPMKDISINNYSSYDGGDDFIGIGGTVIIQEHDFIHNIIKGSLDITAANEKDANNKKNIKGNFSTMY